MTSDEEEPEIRNEPATRQQRWRLARAWYELATGRLATPEDEPLADDFEPNVDHGQDGN